MRFSPSPLPDHIPRRLVHGTLLLFTVGALVLLGSRVATAGADSVRQVGHGAGTRHLDTTSNLAPRADQSVEPLDLQTHFLSEDFEDPTWPSGTGWLVLDGDGATHGEYSWANRCTGQQSARSAWAVGGGASGRLLSCSSSYPDYAESWMVYGPLDFSHVTGGSLQFSFWLNSECEGTDCNYSYDPLWVLASTNGDDYDGGWFAGNWIEDPRADAYGWVSGTLSLDDYAGQPAVWIAFAFESNGSINYHTGALVDNVRLEVDEAGCDETAYIVQATTDRTCYVPGAQIGVLVDVATSLGSQPVRVIASLMSGDIIWAQGEVTFTAPGQRVVTIQVPPDLYPGPIDVWISVLDAHDEECPQDSHTLQVVVDPVCGTITPAVTPEHATQTPTTTPEYTRTTPSPTITPQYPTPTATETECPPVRPPVQLTCTDTNYIRNPYFERQLRSWGAYSSRGHVPLTTQALEGAISANFDAPIGTTADELLYQLIDIPPDVTGVSFGVEQMGRYAAALDYPAPSGLDAFRVSLYDMTMRSEIVRLWEFDPLTPMECGVDAPFYNLTAAQLDAIRGRTVALVFSFHKVTIGWQAGVVLDGINLFVCAPAPPCRVDGDKTASPNVVPAGGEVSVVLGLTGHDGSCLPARIPVDVTLAFDRSGSMEGKPISDAKAAAKNFLDRLDPATDQAALVSFSDAALLSARLTSWPGALRASIDGLAPVGQTNIADALHTAQAELQGPRHRPGNTPVIVLLSDGQPTAGGDPLIEAAAAKAAGTRIFTVGLGDGVDPGLMRQLASAPSDYFAAPTSADLDAVYQMIAGIVGGSPATNITIVDRLSPYVTLVPNSFTGLPIPDVSPDGRTLTWRVPRLGLETRRWGYRVRMTDTPGTWPVNDGASATYTDSEGHPGQVVFPNPEVTVLPVAHGSPEIYCRDRPGDTGAVPSNRLNEAWWDSPDIWVRHNADGLTGHQNPVAGRTNYVYVRVRNSGTADAQNVVVHLYDALGAANIRWPDDWVPEIATVTIPSIAAGGEAVAMFPWTPVVEGHFCFLSRLEATDDPITADGWVPFDNNICQKNVQIIDDGATTSSVNVGNRQRGSGYGSLTLTSSRLPAGTSGTLTFEDPTLFERWQQAGGDVEGGVVVPGRASIRFPGTGRLASSSDTTLSLRIDRIPFEGEETSAITIQLDGVSGDVPLLSLEQWVDGVPVGGNVLRPRISPSQVYLPRALQGTR